MAGEMETMGNPPLTLRNAVGRNTTDGFMHRFAHPGYRKKKNTSNAVKG